MSTALFSNDFSSIFSQDSGEYIRCVFGGGGGGGGVSTPFVRQINKKIP